MSDLQLRIPSVVLDTIGRELSRAPAGREPVVFGFASYAEVDHRRLVLLRDVVVPPEGALLPSTGHGAKWKGAYMIELLNRALAEKLGLFVIHSHGSLELASVSSGAVRMSDDDCQSAAVLLPKFQSIAPQLPHGSIVFGGRSVAGQVLTPGAHEPTGTFSTRFFNNTMFTWPRTGAKSDALLFNRQPIAANPIARTILHDTTVAVVGLSGGGSQVAPQLAALGVGSIIGVDHQRIEMGNLYASSRMSWFDAALRRKKTRAAKTTAWLVNRRTKFICVDARVPESAALEALKSADIIVGCVNNLHARADLMELSWRYCIPYVDIGLVGTVKQPWDQMGPPPLTGLPGNVFVAVPGGPCMWCTEFLTQAKLDVESGGRGRSYLRDGSENDAYVLGFNGVLASQAVSEVLQLLTGYGPEGVQRTYKRYDGLTGTMLECIVRRNPQCPHCKSMLAAGDLTWT